MTARGTEYARGTFIAAEEYSYPNGAMVRPCAAVCPDGKVRRCYAGIPDTYFTIPAYTRIGGKRVKGYLSMDTSTDDAFVTFTPDRAQVSK